MTYPKTPVIIVPVNWYEAQVCIEERVLKDPTQKWAFSHMLSITLKENSLVDNPYLLKPFCYGMDAIYTKFCVHKAAHDCYSIGSLVKIQFYAALHMK